MTSAPASSRYPWGPTQVLYGILGAFGALVVSNVVLVIVVLVTGREFNIEDIGDTFEKANTIAEFAAEKLAAATNGEALPDPPAILADLFLVKIGIAATLVYQVVLVALVVFLSRDSVPELIRRVKLDQFSFANVWQPFAAAFGCYVALGIYAAVVAGLGIDLLEPQSTVPSEIVRDDVAIVLTGLAAVIGAPLSEEMFFRVLIFGGLLTAGSWKFSYWPGGFWPAAVTSSLLFAGVHLDLGSLIPFTIIGIALCWMFWRKGNLWDAIMLHLFFNSTSFILLVTLER